ncbi:MAG TPA: Ig-like domain-containing protein [Gemmatimonadales bacterium]|nr:Ig-like domain-containing protein [Gemmatimonadales bacterium]
MGPPRVAAVDVTPAAVTLAALGETHQFSALPLDASGNPLTGFTITWTSSNQSVARVDDRGLVTALGNGTTQITARAAEVAGVASLVVRQQTTRLRFVGQPTDAVAGEAITPTVTVELEDSAAHRVTDAAVAVTLTLGTNSGGATLAGTLTVTSTGGVASFTDVWLDKVASGYTLRAAAPTLTPTTSGAFSVASAPVQLAFLAQPSSVEGQVPFNPVVQVKAQGDRFGNVVPNAAVTLALAVSPSGESLRGTTTVTAVNGVATFPGLSLGLPGDAFVLEASSGKATPVRSAPFPVRLTFARMSAGAEYTCGVTAVAFAYCWGGNVAGNLGDGTTQQRVIPTPVAGGLLFGSVSASPQNTCGITTSQSASCWGANLSGSLGLGTLEQRFTPAAVVGGLRFADVSVGGLHTCGVTTDHAAYCWGGNAQGELGDGTTTDRLVPTLVAGGLSFAQVSAGTQHTCGVTTGGVVYCWGSNANGELGDGTLTDHLVPTSVLGTLTFVQVSAREAFTCGVAPDNAAYCWGFNSVGQLGDATTQQRLTPTAVAGGLKFAQLDTGYGFACGVTMGGAAYCWGANGNGELGDGTTAQRLQPVLVTGNLTFTGVWAGFAHTCGLTTANGAYCWGWNARGQLGDGTTTQHLTPNRVVQ